MPYAAGIPLPQPDTGPSTPVERTYDEFGGVGYYINVPEGQDYEGNTIYRRMPVSASQIKTEVVSDGEGGNFERAVVPQSVYQETLDKYKELYVPSPVPKDYTRAKEISESNYFSQVPGMTGENVNSFSFGQFGNIWDAINSGAYKVSPDKSQLISPYGTFNLTPIGQGLYDIRMGAKSGGYDVAIGVTDEGKAVLNKDMLDKGALRYVGGSPGGFVQNMLNDFGPVANLALAAYLGPSAGFLTNAAAQTALNAAKGQDFEDALKGGIISGGLTTLAGGTGAPGPGDAGWGSDLGYELPAGQVPISYQDPFGYIPPDTSSSGLGIDTGAGWNPGAPDWGGLDAGPGAYGVEQNMIYGQGEGAFPGTEPGTVALDQSMATMAGAGGAGLAGSSLAGGAAGAAGLTGTDILKYAGLAALAGSALSPKRVITPQGVDQTPVGAELSPNYKPYRYQPYAMGGGINALAMGGQSHLGDYSDGGRLLRGPGDGVSDNIPAVIGNKQPARLADGEFVVPARIVSELGNGSTDAGARKLYAMMDRIQKARGKTTGKKQFAKDTNADKHLPA